MYYDRAMVRHITSLVCQSCLSHDRTIVIAYQFCQCCLYYGRTMVLSLISCVSIQSVWWSYHGLAHYLSVVCQSGLYYGRTMVWHITYQLCVNPVDALWSCHGSAHYLSVVCQSCLSHDRTIVIAYQFCQCCLYYDRAMVRHITYQLCVNPVEATIEPFWSPISSVSMLSVSLSYRCGLSDCLLVLCQISVSDRSGVSIKPVCSVRTIVSRLPVLYQSCLYGLSLPL